MSDAPAARRLPLVAIGVALILVAAVLLAVVLRPRPHVHVDAPSEAAAACRNFEQVYGATHPGSPLDGQALASRLEQAIDHMHKAASGDAKWKALASSLDDLGRAVNADDAQGSFALMQDVHRGCSATGSV